MPQVYKLISTDSHIMEPHDLWKTGVDPKYQARAPIVVQEDEVNYWFCDGKRLPRASGGKMVEDPRDKKFGRDWKEPRKGGWLPEEKIKDMDMDGVWGEVIYPTAGVYLFYVPDSGVFTASARRFNNWLAEFCAPYPNRLRGVALINLDDIDEGAKELERCAHLGLGGAAISVFPKANPYDNSDYDRFWAVAQDTQMSLSFHVGANRTPGLGRSSGKVQGLTHTNFTTASYWVQVSICKMIFSGVFERFPSLKTAIVEHDVGWAPHMISRMDTSYTQRYTRFDEYRYKDSAMLPSDYFHQSVFISFQDDPLGIQHRDIIGVDNLMWGSDYPHPEGTFPKSVEVLSEILKDVPQQDAEKIRAGNAARVYGMNLPGEA